MVKKVKSKEEVPAKKKGFLAQVWPWVFVVVVLAVAIYLVVYSLQNPPPPQPPCVPTPVYNREIGVLNLGSQISGTFFLATGGVGEQMTYYFYEQQDAGGKFLMVIPANRVLVYDKDDVPQPYVELIGGRRYEPDATVACVLGLDRVPEHMAFSSFDVPMWYEIHVPPGTTVQLLQDQKPQ